ncbi:YiiX/YebB-like N1pC/P60 family cysteine hydrolase [Ammoniphilus sp. CFH 90114]|uniref:YiiX/YebB-like N1pC/P60 family cysteine hydrolase n=1 Tax=Ammoniphilus sp. CFH 90114 TaxID=2493665 RepID=UPI00100EAB22|nr:YiiX/YebB-like N1pC/P60 family cysteine hydrolase [Ammoniphilus sp. CFH 90114]RXT07277.1 hypothetical protein EIZ39_14155 [Ammoniphilus sp. CFH 90114]
MNRPIVLGLQGENYITLTFNLVDIPLQYFELYLDRTYIGSYLPVPVLQIPTTWFNSGHKSLNIVSIFLDGGRVRTSLFYNHHIQTERDPRDFQPGDILVASDNTNGLQPGYMGHSALIIDKNTIAEAVMTDPQVRFYPLEHFLSEHPRHVQYRPKDPNLGHKARNYAYQYVLQYQKNKNSGKEYPEFSFLPDVPLNDQWGSIYCSKLIWLSYYYGAGLTLENDFIVFAPLNLSSSLENDNRFQLVYKHPDFHFFIEFH